MHRWIRWILDNFCIILMTIGCGAGILSFFINWETLDVVTTTGLDLAFGDANAHWFQFISYEVYIPLAIFLCSLISSITLVATAYHQDKIHKIMILVIVLSVIMLSLMTYWAGCGFDFNGQHVYFAEYAGIGTLLGWSAAWMLMVGSGLYVASEVLEVEKDGQ